MQNDVPTYTGPAKKREPLTPEQIQAMSDEAAVRRRYEKRRNELLDEAVLCARLISNRIGVEKAGDIGQMAATIFAAWLPIAGVSDE